MTDQAPMSHCNDCGTEFVVNIEHRPVNGEYTEEGFECPMCHHWYHMQYLSEELEQQHALLKRFYANAHKSVKHSARYWRKKEQYARSHRAVQARVKGLLAHAT